MSPTGWFDQYSSGKLVSTHIQILDIKASLTVQEVSKKERLFSSSKDNFEVTPSCQCGKVADEPDNAKLLIAQYLLLID